MNKRLSRLSIVLSAVLFVVSIAVFPGFSGAADATSPCKDGTCNQTGQMRAEWKAISAYRLDSDVMGGAGDILSYLLLRDQKEKDAFHQKMRSFQEIASRYGELTEAGRYRENKETEAFLRLCDAQKGFEATATAIIDAAASKDSDVPPQQLSNLEHAIDGYAKAAKSMKEALLSGVTPEAVKKDPELHAVLNLADAMATALDATQEAYTYILMNDREATVNFFAKMTGLNTLFTRYKELASIGQNGKEKRSGLYADVLKARDDLIDSAKRMFASCEKTKTHPTTELVSFKKDAGHLVSLVEELIDLMGAEGVSPCNTR
jgi:hypothetical protein